MSNHAVLGEAMTEAQLQTAVIGMARYLHWKVAHFRPAINRSGKWGTPVQADGAGFPDLLMVRGERCLAVELKKTGGKLSVKQAAWLEAFACTGVEARVWDTRDWLSGHVEKELQRAVRETQ